MVEELPMWTAVSAAALLLVTAAPAPKKTERKLEPPTVKFLRASSEMGHGWVTFEATNPNPSPLPFFGCSVKPKGKSEGTRYIAHYEVTALRAGKWEPFTPKRCKIRVDPVTIPARGKVTFDVSVPAGTWDEIKVGLRWFPSADREAPMTAWSAKVTRRELTPSKQ